MKKTLRNKLGAYKRNIISLMLVTSSCLMSYYPYHDEVRSLEIFKQTALEYDKETPENLNNKLNYFLAYDDSSNFLKEKDRDDILAQHFDYKVKNQPIKTTEIEKVLLSEPQFKNVSVQDMEKYIKTYQKQYEIEQNLINNPIKKDLKDGSNKPINVIDNKKWNEYKAEIEQNLNTLNELKKTVIINDYERQEKDKISNIFFNLMIISSLMLLWLTVYQRTSGKVLLSYLYFKKLDKNSKLKYTSITKEIRKNYPYNKQVFSLKKCWYSITNYILYNPINDLSLTNKNEKMIKKTIMEKLFFFFPVMSFILYSLTGGKNDFLLNLLLFMFTFLSITDFLIILENERERKFVSDNYEKLEQNHSIKTLALMFDNLTEEMVNELEIAQQTKTTISVDFEKTKEVEKKTELEVKKTLQMNAS